MEASRPAKPLGAAYLPALTGIRAVAALMVCVHHYNPLGGWRGLGGWRSMAYGFCDALHTGVTIFFVLSGFLICYRYYESVQGLSWPWFRRYLLNRVARIYPLYLLLTLLTFALLELNPARYELVPPYAGLPPTERLAVLGLNLTLLKGFFDEYKYSGIAQGWSLTVEECFYLSAPLLLLWVRRRRRTWLLAPLAALLLGGALVLTLGRLPLHGLFADLKFMLNFTFLGRCLEFFIGMGLAVYLRQQPARPARRGLWLTLLGLGLSLGCLLALARLSIGGSSQDSYAGIGLNNAGLPLAIALLFYGLLTERSWLRSLLSTRLLDLLGRSSYAFYLIHVGVLNILLRTYLGHSPALQFGLLNVIAILLYQFVESPLHRWLRPR